MALLAAQGYAQKERLLWQAYFERADGLGLDLHWRLAPRWDPVPASFEELWARARPVSLLGSSVPTFGPEDLLLVFSIQLVMDARSSRQRLIQLCDTVQLLHSYPEMDWDAVFRRAGAVGARRMLLLNLRLAHGLLGAPLPPRMLHEVQRGGALRRLAEQVERGLEHRGGERRPATPGVPAEFADHRFYLRARERLRDKVEYLRMFAKPRPRLWITPTARDRAFVHLPGPLGFLYYLVRPVRVLWQWAATGRLRTQTRAPEVRAALRTANRLGRDRPRRVGPRDC
jgi:hypothetical protein